MEVKISIVIPAYNEQDKIKRAILSATSQEYNNFEVWVYDDGSTDDTLKIAKEVRATNLHIVSNGHIGSPVPYFRIHSVLSDDNHIVVHLDADDYLPHVNVLNVVAKAYQDPNIWMTYGQFITDKGDMGFCGEVKDTRSYRYDNRLLVSHLRTHKAGLMKHVKRQDLLDSNGRYFRTANDQSFLYPMVEMCGTSHMKFINEVLYVYDTTDPTCKNNAQLNEHKKRLIEIKAKPQYKEIESL